MTTSYNIGLVQEAYATTCPFKYRNSVVDSSLIISCSKDFIYNDTLIEANTNIIGLSTLDVGTNFFGAYLVFTKEFILKSKFENTEYNFNFRLKTTDNLEFRNSIELYVDL